MTKPPRPDFGARLECVLALLSRPVDSAEASRLIAQHLQEREQPAAEPQLSLLKEPYGSLVE